MKAAAKPLVPTLNGGILFAALHGFVWASKFCGCKSIPLWHMIALMIPSSMFLHHLRRAGHVYMIECTASHELGIDPLAPQ